jgi:hopene-associated glycosyltransferase HpnB
MLEIIAFFTVLLWLYLLTARGGFWLAQPAESQVQPPAPSLWPAVIAVIPARDEAATIARNVTSVLDQNYPGSLRAVLVDDGSQDGTASIAQDAAAEIGAGDRLTVLPGQPLPGGWTGKLWALKQGIETALSQTPSPKYLLLTDADILYEGGAFADLIVRAEHGATVLTSLMVKLNCESFAERALVPAFVFFFQMLYPFAWVNAKNRATAAAAGGCMLVRVDALAKIGGIESIRDALIDDCALGRQMKRVGPVWLGLSKRVHSIRRYDNFGSIRKMITRSAYAELRYSAARLLAATLGMALTFLAAPILAIFGAGMTALLGLAGWIAMAISFQPILRFYRLNPMWGATLPLIALAYTALTVESALQYVRGQGGAWKGRIQAAPREAR